MLGKQIDISSIPELRILKNSSSFLFGILRCYVVEKLSIWNETGFIYVRLKSLHVLRQATLVFWTPKQSCFYSFLFFALKKTHIIMIFKSAQVNECWNTSWMCPDDNWIWFRLQTKSYPQFEKLIMFQNRIEQLFFSYDDVVDLDYVLSFSRQDESLSIRIEKQNIKSHVLMHCAFFIFWNLSSLLNIDWQFRSHSFSPSIKVIWFIGSCQFSYLRPSNASSKLIYSWYANVSQDTRVTHKALRVWSSSYYTRNRSRQTRSSGRRWWKIVERTG